MTGVHHDDGRVRGAGGRGRRYEQEKSGDGECAHGSSIAIRHNRPMEDLASLLAPAIADATRISLGESDRDTHAGDLTFHRPVRPDAVVYPTSTAEVAAVLAVANDHAIAVTPYGAGSSLEGHVIPVAGGISLDLTRLDAILELSPGDLLARAQAGVTRQQLNRAAGEHGLWFPIDPGADATLGGMAATNAAGTTTPRYGKMREQVLALEAVLPSGAIVRTGARASKTSAGYDLTSLLIGSEGTLAVITELTIRLRAIPEAFVTARLAFEALAGACETATSIVTTGLTAHRVELLDGPTIRAVNAYAGADLPERPTLLVELAGAHPAIDADLELLTGLAEGAGLLDLEVERDPTRRGRIWEARHSAAYAFSAASPGKRGRSTDTCVPLTELAGALEAARATMDELGLDGALLGHAGDGNLHVHAMVDPEDPDQRERLERLSAAVVADALARGGTATGEHGIGLGKIGYLETEHADLLPLYRGVKTLFDPRGIMNPGKVLRS